MIRAIIKPTMHELLTELSRKGLKLSDIDGVSRNESGHYFTVLQSDEVDDGIIDTTAGKIGVSKAVCTVNSARTACGVSHTTVTGSTISSTTATATINLHALGTATYVIPGTVSIEDADSVAPDLIDDGLGNLKEPNTGVRRGVINYTDGEVTFNYHASKYPTANVEATFKHSAEPCVTNVPNQVKLKGIYVTGGAGTAATVSIFDSSSGGVPAYSATIDEGYYDLGGRISIQQDLTLSDRKYRWVSIADVTKLTTVYLYWERM